ncbi:MAG: RnfH family protein [Magnetococcales bacterium]|nr:RnfH family protein [Magnetococcales bacterium]
MRVAVTYAEPRKQWLLEFEMPDGCTAEQAIRRSGLLEKCPQIDLVQQKIGIYSKLVPLDQLLQPGDRVEIYRPAVGKPPKKGRDKPAGEGDESEEG